MSRRDHTIGNALDKVQNRFGTFGFGNLMPHLKSFKREEINAVHALDCGEKLITVRETNRIFFIENSPAIISPYIRENDWEMLQIASEYLPAHLGFGHIELYRSAQRQQEMRERRFWKIKDEQPKLTDENIWKIVDTFLSRVGGPHQTGGAQDVALIDLNTRQPLDMGSPWSGTDHRSYTASNIVSLEAQVHRYILCMIMNFSGFRNYPNEWWHYEYGTKRHAKYLQFDTCKYAPIAA